MAKVKTKVIGDKQLIAKFHAMKRSTRGEVLQVAVKAGLLPIQNEAITLAPKLSGTLSRSIHTEIVKVTPSSCEGFTGTDLEYAARREFGFHAADSLGRNYNDPPQPYMRPAYDNRKGEALKETQAVLIILIHKAAGV